jgi:hypothetical protein
MQHATDDAQRIVDDVLADPRLPTAEGRCKVLKDLVSWGRAFTAERYGQLEACRAFPL